MDMSQGIVCSLTGNKPDFQDTCQNFNLDERMEAEMQGSPAYNSAEISSTISSRLRAEQNLPLAITGGILVGLVGAVLWAMITVATGWQIGYMALGIGAGVGFTIRYLGQGIDQIFGISGAGIAVLSCIIGNFLGVLGFISDAEGLSYFDTLLFFDYTYTFQVLSETAQFMDLIFYGIAGYEGYKFAFRQLNQAQLAALR
jgi:hypothetical protein